MAAVTVGLLGCSDDGTSSADDVGHEPVSLTEQLTEAGLPPGSYRVFDGGDPICTQTLTYPGGGRVDVPFDLSGFGNFDLLVSDEQITVRGAYDELSALWTEDLCVEYDSSRDTLTSHTSCEAEEDEACTPFSRVRICANGGEPTFFAVVPECDHPNFNTFPVFPAE